MAENSGTLSTPHGVRNIGAAIIVRISDTPNTIKTGSQARFGAGVDLAILHFQAHVRWDRRALRCPEVGQERISDHRLALGEVNAEDIELFAIVASVVTAVLHTLEGRNGSVVDLDVVRLHGGAPVQGVCVQSRNFLISVGAVHERNDVLVQSRDLGNTGDNVVQGSKDTVRLVAVLISIAPGAPVDALSEAFAETGSGGEVIDETGGQDDLACGVLGTLGVFGAEDGGCIGAVLGSDGGDGVVDERGRAVVERGDLLSGRVAECGRGSALSCC